MQVPFPAGKGKLLFAKSKVYLHVSPSKSQNIPGFLTIIQPFKGATNTDIIVAFIVESDLSTEDKKTLEYFDLYGLDGENADKLYSSSNNNNDSEHESFNYNERNIPVVSKYIDRPKLSSLSSFSFGVTISNLFSCQIRPKAPNFWHGSIILHPKDSLEKLPALFFHDDECPGTKREQKLRSRNFEPFATNTFNGLGDILYWGGDRFLSCLKNYCVLEESPLEKGMILINPTKDDLINFIPNVIDNKNNKNNDPLKQASESFNEFVTTAKWRTLGALAQITKNVRSMVGQVAKNENVPEPIKALLAKPSVQVISDEFDSANVYLAKWALAVEEEAEKSRKVIIGNDQYRELIKTELGDNFIELTPFEVSKATRLKPVTKIEWDSFFDHTGRLQITVDEVLDRIFHGGLEENIRSEAWPFILKVYPWDTSNEEREQLYNQLSDSFEQFKDKWEIDIIKQDEDEYWKDQKFRIDKDIKRTDRELDIYKGNTGEVKPVTSVTGNENNDDNENDDNANDNDDDDDDSEIKNPNLLKLRHLLFTYNELNENLGYVQGMTDLISPLYYVYRDETLTFWSFVNFMERMERNFLRDQSGMKNQMLTLTELVQFMLPELYIHLEKCYSNNLFFFFRMLLVWYKREFSYNDTMRLWEVLWTDYYSSQFILFFSLAVLEKHSRIIIDNLNAFDQVLKYMNDLSGNLDLNDILVRAELLFLKFKQMVDIIDRKYDGVGIHNLHKGIENLNVDDVNTTDQEVSTNSDANTNTTTVTSADTTSSTTSAAVKKANPISKDLRQLLSREIVIQREGPRPEGKGTG